MRAAAVLSRHRRRRRRRDGRRSGRTICGLGRPRHDCRSGGLPDRIVNPSRTLIGLAGALALATGIALLLVSVALGWWRPLIGVSGAALVILGAVPVLLAAVLQHRAHRERDR